MSVAMVTGRMSEEKKMRGARVLKREGLNASQAINLMYDRLVKEGSARFISERNPEGVDDWARAARFVDSLSEPRESRFDSMSKAQIKEERLRSRGLM